MRERAAQELNPEMGRMGAEDPSTAFRPRLFKVENRQAVVGELLLGRGVRLGVRSACLFRWAVGLNRVRRWLRYVVSRAEL
jgi:hypothetical protein